MLIWTLSKSETVASDSRKWCIPLSGSWHVKSRKFINSLVPMRTTWWDSQVWWNGRLKYKIISITSNAPQNWYYRGIFLWVMGICLSCGDVTLSEFQFMTIYSVFSSPVCQIHTHPKEESHIIYQAYMQILESNKQQRFSIIINRLFGPRLFCGCRIFQFV